MFNIYNKMLNKLLDSREFIKKQQKQQKQQSTKTEN